MAEIVSQYRIEVKQAVDALNQVADTTETTEKNLKKTGDTGKKTGADIKAAANEAEKGLNAINPTLGRVVNGFRAMVGGVKAVIGAMRTLKIAIAATGIGLIILAIGAITAAATRLQPVMDRLGVIFAQVGQVVNVLVDRVAHLGAGLLEIATGNFAGGFNRIKESLSGIGDEMSREIELAGILKRQLQEMEKARLINSATVAKLRADIDELNATYQDETVSIEDQIKAQQKILKLRGLISDALTRETKEMIANALGQTEVTAETDKFIDTLRSQENLLLSTSEKAAKAAELIKQLGLDESTVKDLEQAVELVNRYTAAEQERVQGVRRVNSAIIGLNNQIIAGEKEKQKAQEEAAKQAAELQEKANEERLKKEAETQAAIEKAEAEHAKRIEEIRKGLASLTLAIDEELNTALQDVLRRQVDAIKQTQFERQAVLMQSLQNQLMTIEEYEKAAMEVDAAAKATIEVAEKEHQDRLKKLREEAVAKDVEGKREQLNATLNYIQTSAQLFSQLSGLIMQGYDNEFKALENNLESGQISREEYDQKRRELERKRASDQKTLSLFDAVLNTAAAVTAALAVGPPAGFILAALSAALGAAQIGIIASQPLPQFADGGWVDGRGMIQGRAHAQGGVKLEAEGGEFIVNRAASAKNAALIEAINKGMGEAYIMRKWVAPAVDAALLNGWQDVGRSAELNGLTATLKDHNIIRAMDRNRETTAYGFKLLADKLNKRTPKRGGYA